MKEQARDNARSQTRASHLRRLRPVDGFVVGGEALWQSGDNLWLMLSQPGERLIDFFLEDEKSETDPAPCACGGILADGTLVIGEIDWEMDRFLSEMLDEQEAVHQLD